MFNKTFWKFVKCCLLLITTQVLSITEYSRDQTSTRSNTLIDDADDIQRQLDNEARDRAKYGRPNTIWVLHFPNRFENPTSMPMKFQYTSQKSPFYPRRFKSEQGNLPVPKEWDYGTQENWAKSYPDCGARSQSPVDLPATGLLKSRGARRILFQNYDVVPHNITLSNDGTRVVLSGQWAEGKRPLIYGGAAHGRRYLFHSLTFHSPSEHRVASLNYPLESQAYFVSAEYKDWDEAMASAAGDPQALLGVVSLYKFGNCTHPGTCKILNAIKNLGYRHQALPPMPLMYYHPPFFQYVCYQGSLPYPPCTEDILWFVRARAMCLSRCSMDAVQAMVTLDNPFNRLTVREPQPLNDRKVYFFT